jgi:hypothetical protein
VYVWVDPARHHEFAADVHDLRGVRQDAGGGDTDNTFALDTDVPGPNTMRGHNLATAYQQIQHVVDERTATDSRNDSGRLP